MAISKIGGSQSDNWELISSVTPTALSAAVNFTGLNPYSKLMVVVKSATLSASNELDLRINNDSGTNYFYSFWNGTPDIRQSIFTTGIEFTAASSEINAMIEIHNCDNTGLKIIEPSWGGISADTTIFIRKGIYVASAIVTQINVITGSTFAGAGTVALYGVK